jgi:hypothetical protein
MKNGKKHGLCATAVAVALVGAMTLGVHNLVLLALVLMCPLMVFFMMHDMRHR